MDDLHGSDHFSVLVQFNQVETAPSTAQWDFRHVNWDLYFDLCTSDLTEEAVFSREDPALQFPSSNPVQTHVAQATLVH